MPQLGLSVSADDLQVPGGSEEGVQLRGGRLVQQRRQEHPQVEVQRLGETTVHKSEVGGNFEEDRTPETDRKEVVVTWRMEEDGERRSVCVHKREVGVETEVEENGWKNG